MPHNRFYAPTLDPITLLTDEEHNHLSRVMRVREGETVELVDGKGLLATGTVRAIRKRETEIEIIHTEKKEPLPRTLILAIPLMRQNSLELIVEKCTEIGATAFYFYPAERSEKDALSDNNKRRLHTLAISAMKQCGRLDLPPLHFSRPETAPLFFGDLETDARFPHTSNATFFSGPEAGFTPKELAALHERGTGLSLGPYTLRAETAPLVFASQFFAH